MNDTLKFYSLFDRLAWPRSYLGKVFLIAFLATHIPLLTLICFFYFGPAVASKLSIFVLILLATLIGTILVIFALHEMLKPVLLAARALNQYLYDGEILQLPTNYRDEVGSLLSNAAYALQTIEQRRIRLEQIASEDYLTGLQNRQTADQRLQQNLSQAAQNQQSFCVALIDVDYLQRMNDTYGHEIGDRILIKLGQYLKRAFRNENWVARWSGQQFLLVLFSNARNAQTVLEQIRTDIAQLKVAADATEFSFTISVGFTVIRPGDSLQTCVERATQALYRAKQTGRDRVQFYEAMET